MATDADNAGPPSRTLLLLEGRAVLELGAFFIAAPWLRMTARGDGHPVLVLPGLGASDVSTRPLRSFLAGRGYAVHGWGRGRNLGRRNMVDLYLVPRLKDLRQRYDRRVSVIGWSLGGIYARELAKRAPDDVRLVITLGSPFAGNPKASNVWRLFEASSGRKVDDDPEARRRRREPPPVPTTAIFSRTDGIVAWQRCTEQESPIGWRSPRASGDPSTAVASSGCSIPTQVVARAPAPDVRHVGIHHNILASRADDMRNDEPRRPPQTRQLSMKVSAPADSSTYSVGNR
jgi:pimeloyl-ACP methyl ester carboxylesterase